MSKKSTLSAALATAAGKPQPMVEPATRPGKTTAQPKPVKQPTVLIAAHYAPEFRRVLKHIEAETGKNLKQLLGRAINQLAVEHGKPEPYTEEA